MRWQDAAKALKRIAPPAAAALGGPAGGLAATVIAGALGVEKTPAAVVEAIRTDPEAAIKLAAVEADLAKAAMLDVQDARRAHAGHWMTWLVPLILLLLFAAAGASVFLVEVPISNQRIADLLLGSLLGMTASGVAYWVASSSGSAIKSAQLDAKR